MMLRILHVAFPYAPVGPRTCGGAEQVLTDLDRALTAAGHHSAVVACQGSRSTGPLFTAPMPHGHLDGSDSDRGFWQCRYQEAIDRALASGPFDLVHMHGLDWHGYHLPSSLPTLVTLHMPIAWYPSTMWQQQCRNVHFQCVSEHQRVACPDPNAAMVENGVELPPLHPSAPGHESGVPARPNRRVAPGKADLRPFALALGRICPEKNLHQALEAGTAAGLRVLVGGQTFPYASHIAYEQLYFRPALRGSGTVRNQHRFLGPLRPGRKQQLLREARCLLHPTLAPETSSLVAMEALAAGTPVIAFPSGAIPEIIDHGRTGFLVHSTEEMAAAILRAPKLDRALCRRVAHERFDRTRMVSAYLDLIAHLARPA